MALAEGIAKRSADIVGETYAMRVFVTDEEGADKGCKCVTVSIEESWLPHMPN